MQGNHDGDGAHAMQQAFQDFMLSGGNQDGNKSSGKKKKKGKKQRASPGAQPLVRQTKATPIKSPANAEHQQFLQRQKARKQYWQILNAFRKTLEEDWIGVDDHLGDVIASVVNLRDRIRKTSKHLQRWEQGHTSTPPPGHGFGYRSRPSHANAILGHLTSDDLELALSHDLIQHEKMLAGTRRLLSSLNQAQEALGRRLDELLKFHLEMVQSMVGGIDEKDEAALALFANQVVDWCRQVYTELAQELYRKQELIQTVLDSVTDNLLHQEDDDLLLGDGEDDATPIRVAEKSKRLWPRGSSEGDDSDSYLKNLLAMTPWNQDDDKE